MAASKGVRKRSGRKEPSRRELPTLAAILEYGGVREARNAFDRLATAGVAPDVIVYNLQRVIWWHRAETTMKLIGFPPHIPSYTIKRLAKYLEDMATRIAALTSFPPGDLRNHPLLAAGYRLEHLRLLDLLRSFANHLREEPKRIGKIAKQMQTSCKLEFLESVRGVAGNYYWEAVATLLTAALVADGHSRQIVTARALKMLQKRRHKHFVELTRTGSIFPSDLQALAAIADRDQQSLIAQLFPPTSDSI